MSDIETKLKAIVVGTLWIPEEDLTPDADIINDLGADSLDIIEVIMETERVFGIAIPDDEIDGLRTFKGLVEYVEKATSKVP